MTVNEKKASQFIKAINAEADAQSKKIKSETDAFVASELKMARKIAKENAKSVAKLEMSNRSEQSNTDSYKTRTQLVTQIINKRKEIAQKVFDKAEKELAEFTSDDDYAAFLQKSVESIKEAIGENAVIFIRQADEKHKEMLLKICKEVEFDNTIRLGGCKGVNGETAMRADDTLDSRFEQQKKLFYERSGLSVIG